MKRRDYIKSVSSTALLPILANQADPLPTIDDTWWKTSLANSSQLMTITTTAAVDRLSLRRYAFKDLSNQPTYQQVTDTKHELVFDSPTTVTGLHGIGKHRDGRLIGEEMVDLTPDLLARHIELSDSRTARVAVRNNGDAPVASYNGAVITDTEQEPDFTKVAGWQNQRFVPLLPKTTSYVSAHVTPDAEKAMMGHQTVWVWLKNEEDAWFPATVDFDRFDPVEIYDLNGVTRH